MSDTIKIKGKNYTVCSFRGKVLQNRTRTTSETTVTGGGGGGVMIDGTGYIRQNPMRAPPRTPTTPNFIWKTAMATKMLPKYPIFICKP